MSTVPTINFFSEARFPQELRDLVWKFAVQAEPPRIVELTGGHEDTLCDSDGVLRQVKYNYVSNAPTPATLHACSRSREIASKRWTLTFDSSYIHLIGMPFDDVLHPRTWFDFRSDTLLFMESASQHDNKIHSLTFLQMMQDFVLMRIQNVILNMEPEDDILGLHYLHLLKDYRSKFMHRLSGLKSFSVSFQGWDEDTPGYDLLLPDTIMELKTPNEVSNIFYNAVLAMFRTIIEDMGAGKNQVVVKRVLIRSVQDINLHQDV